MTPELEIFAPPAVTVPVPSLKLKVSKFRTCIIVTAALRLQLRLSRHVAGAQRPAPAVQPERQLENDDSRNAATQRKTARPRRCGLLLRGTLVLSCLGQAADVLASKCKYKSLTRTMKVKSEHHKASGSSSAKAHRVRAATNLPSHWLSETQVQRSELEVLESHRALLVLLAERACFDKRNYHLTRKLARL